MAFVVLCAGGDKASEAIPVVIPYLLSHRTRVLAAIAEAEEEAAAVEAAADPATPPSRTPPPIKTAANTNNGSSSSSRSQSKGRSKGRGAANSSSNVANGQPKSPVVRAVSSKSVTAAAAGGGGGAAGGSKGGGGFKPISRVSDSSGFDSEGSSDAAGSGGLSPGARRGSGSFSSSSRHMKQSGVAGRAGRGPSNLGPQQQEQQQQQELLQNLEQIACVLDTALLKAMLLQPDSGALLRFVQGRNYVDLEEGEVALRGQGRYAELAALYQYGGHHAQGLELLRQLSQAPEELQVTPAGAAADLKGLPGVWAAVR